MSPKRGRPRTGQIPNLSIRLDRDVHHKARVAAVSARKTVGQWLGEAIEEKIARETEAKNNDDTN